MANEKYIMMSENPTGTGAFSMNRKAKTEIGLRSTAEGFHCEASGANSHAEGGYTTASGNASHAEGTSCRATAQASHAEGDGTTASEYDSHAEGNSTTASGQASHAEGYGTKASGPNSHAEGVHTEASGYYSHAEGLKTKASGSYSHSGGNSTIAGYRSQTAIGEYNDNKEENIFEVGNGTSDARSNALELTKTGDLKIGGSYIDGSGNVLSLDSANEYTDQKIADLINGAPTTLDTLKEIADAMEESQGVVDALDKAIGTKANASDLTAHTSDTNNPHNVTAEQTPYDPTESGLSAQNVQNAVDEVNDNFNNIEIGGRNLYLGTKDFNGNWYKDSLWTAYSETYKGFTVKKRTGNFNGLYQIIQANVGDVLTFSGYVKKDSSGKMYVFAIDDSDKEHGTAYPINKTFTVEANTWTRVSFTFKVTVSGKFAFRFENPEEGIATYVCGLKLERGNKATDWTPAPEDIETEIQSVEKQVTTNLLKPTLETTTVNGITCTNNGDGTYTLNGTASANAIFKLSEFNVTDSVKMVGCPKDGSISTFKLSAYANQYPLDDIGNGTSLDIHMGKTVEIRLVVYSGTTIVNKVFKPMLTTNLNATYDDFVPFTGNTGSLNGDVADLRGNVSTALNEKAPKTNPVFTGSFSHNRKAGTTIGINSFAEGLNTTASGSASHAEGAFTTASGNYSHAEGAFTTASGNYSHAEGNNTKASGASSHAEGLNTTASSDSSHAEGAGTTASGISSHAEGLNTIAAGEEQHVEGKYNVQDTENKYAHIIGGGTNSTKRRNIHTVDWSGNAYYAGDVTTASKSLNKAPQLIYTLATGNTDASETIDVTNNYTPTHQYLYTINAAGSNSYEVGLVMYINNAYKFVPLASSNTSKTLGDSTSVVGITISFSTSQPGPHFNITRSGSSYGSTCNIYQLS